MTIEKIVRYFTFLLTLSSLVAVAQEISPNLSEGFTFVESLKSVDGAYIETGVSQKGATNSVQIEAVIDVVALESGKRQLMGFDGKKNNYFGLSAQKKFEVGGKEGILALENVRYRLLSTQTANGIRLEIFKVDSQSGEETFLQTIENNANAGFNNSSCKIFRISGFSCPGLQLHAFKIIIDGKLQGDFRPVWNEPEKFGALYDVVNGKLFKNAGKGNFVVGETDSNLLNLAAQKIFAPVETSLKKLDDKKPKNKTVALEKNLTASCLRSVWPVVLAAFLVSLLLSGLYAFARSYFSFALARSPIFLISFLILVLWLGGLTHCLPLSLLFLGAVSVYGWFLIFKKTSRKFWRDSLWQDFGYLFFLLGIFIIGLSVRTLTIEGEKVALNFMPFLSQLSVHGSCLEYFRHHDLAVLGVLSWLLNKLSFGAFNQSSILWAQLILVLSAFSTILSFYRVRSGLVVLWLLVFFLALALLDSTVDFYFLLGGILLGGGALFLNLLASSKRFAYKILTLALATVVFLFLLASPNQDLGTDFRYVFPTGTFAIWLFGVTLLIIAYSKTKKLWAFLFPLIVLLLLAPTGQIFFAIGSGFLFLLFLLLAKRARKTLLKSDALLLVFWLCFSALATLVFVSKAEFTSNVAYNFGETFLQSTTKCGVIAWHSEKLSDGKHFTTVSQILNALSNWWQAEPIIQNVFCFNHFLLLTAFAILALLLLLLFGQPTLKTTSKISLASGFVFLLFGALLVFVLSLYLAKLNSLFEIGPKGVWLQGSLIFFPIIALLCGIILGYSFKVINLIRRRNFINALLLLALIFPAIFLYLWLPNRSEIWHGVKVGAFNQKFQALFSKIKSSATCDRLLILSKAPLQRLEAAYLLLNLPQGYPKQIAFISLDDEAQFLGRAASLSDKILWVTGLKNQVVNLPLTLENLFCVTNYDKFRSAALFQKTQVDNHIYFLEKKIKPSAVGPNLLKNASLQILFLLGICRSEKGTLPVNQKSP